MTELSVEREIAAPADDVWALITDLQASQGALRGIEEIVHVEGPFPRIEVGTVWDEARRMMGRTEVQRLRVTEVDEAGMRYVVEADAHGTRYRSELAVQPTGDASCTLRMGFGGEPQTTSAKVLGATLGWMGRGATKKALQQDLDDIAAAVSA